MVNVMRWEMDDEHAGQELAQREHGDTHHDTLERAAPSPRLQEQVLRLYCQGWRVYAIAGALGISEWTAREVLDAALNALDREMRANRGQWRLRAIESVRGVAAAAWAGYERMCALERIGAERQSDDTRPYIQPPLPGFAPPTEDADGEDADGDEPPSEPDDAPMAPLAQRGASSWASQCARYLALALAAQREVARLQGLYEQAGQEPRDVRIILERREPGPENLPPSAHDD